MDVDYIIVGQGICGTFLSYYLLQENQSVCVIDDNKFNSASRVASGVINPVTGRRIVKTWKIDELMPFAENAYKRICDFLKVDTVLQSKTILDIHATTQMQQAFEKRLNEQEHQYIEQSINTKEWQKYFYFEHGIGIIKPAYSIELNNLLTAWRLYLESLKCLREQHFEMNRLQLKNDYIQYKNIVAKKIIFCDGINSVANIYFKQLPFAFNKGEALIVSIPDMPRDCIYKLRFSIVPYGNKDLFWIGSSYEWNFENNLPTYNFKDSVEKFLNQFLKIPFTTKNHVAAIRPSNTERRPFVGVHTHYPQIGILNGMGTKGCSLAPFYANQLTQNILYNIPIDEEADVRRFFK